MKLLIALLSIPIAAMLISGSATASHGGRFCSKTTSNLFSACRYDSAEEYLVGRAQCLNIGDRADRRE